MISFFFPKKHSGALSVKIRVNQLAEFLDAKINPEDGYGDDVCIYLKPNTLDGYVPKGAWVDVADGGKFVRRLKDRPDLKLIANTKASFEYLKSKLPNKIVYCLHHHLNWEREKRTRTEINTCGYTGGYSRKAVKTYEDMATELEKEGMDFVTHFRFKGREQAKSFYRKIDIMVIGSWELGDTNVHKAPTKIINAASFGIPAVAFPLRGYQEIEGYYLPARNMKEVIEQVNKLKNKEFYNSWVEKILPMAEKHHIENIINLYKDLK